MKIKKINFLGLLLFSFSTANILVHSYYSLKDALPGYVYDPNYKEREQEWIDLFKHDNSPRISKNQIPKELLAKVYTVLEWVNIWEHNRTMEGVGNKLMYHELNAKINPQEYYGMNFDTTLTEKKLEYITKWFDEKYEQSQEFHKRVDEKRKYDLWMNKNVYRPLTVAAILAFAYGAYKGARWYLGYDSQEEQEIKPSDSEKDLTLLN